MLTTMRHSRELTNGGIRKEGDMARYSTVHRTTMSIPSPAVESWCLSSGAKKEAKVLRFLRLCGFTGLVKGYLSSHVSSARPRDGTTVHRTPSRGVKYS